MMKIFTYLILAAIFSASSLSAQDSTNAAKTEHHKITHGKYFVDKNGDGYNDNAPDHDGDGIPNGLDPDYLKIKKRGGSTLPYIDLNGDGINDNLQFKQRRKRNFNHNLTEPQHGNMNQNGGGDGKHHRKGKKGGG